MFEQRIGGGGEVGMIAKWVGTEGQGRGGAKIKSPGISFSFVKFFFCLFCLLYIN